VKRVKTNFLPFRRFVDDDDLAHQSLAWEQDKTQQRSQAHGQRPADLLAQEGPSSARSRRPPPAMGSIGRRP
jgi:hypothetical protein